MADPAITVPEDLKRLMRNVGELDDTEREEFLQRTDALFAGATPQRLARFDPVARVKWWLAKEHRLEELTEVVRYEREHPGAFPIAGTRTPRLAVPGLNTASLPKEVVSVARRELPLVARLTDMTWHNGRLHLRGYAYVRNVGMERRPRVPRLAWLTHAETKRRVMLRVHPRREPRATEDSKQPLHCYDWAGFEIVIDPRRLGRAGVPRQGTWTLTLAALAPGGLRRSGITKGEIGTSGHAQGRVLPGGTRWVCEFDADRLRFRAAPVAAEVTAQECDGATLRLRLRLARPLTRLALEHTADGETTGSAYELVKDAERPGEAEVALPVQELRRAAEPAQATEDLRVRVADGEGRGHPVLAGEAFVPGTFPLSQGREVAVSTTQTGELILHDRTQQAVVDHVEWRGHALHVTGTYGGSGEGTILVLRHGQRFEEVTWPLQWTDGRFHAEIAPEHVEYYGEAYPLRKGRWYLTLRGGDAWNNDGDVPVKIRTDLIARLPLRHQGAGREFSVDHRFHDRVFINSGSPLDEQDRGAYRQRWLRTEFSEQQRALPVRDTVFYYNLHGRQYSDSPRMILQELRRRGLPLEHVWAVEDGQVPAPEGVRTVEWGSRECYEAMFRSRYLVTNVAMDGWFTRREGQTVVQTWHGTPLKMLGADLLGTPKANRSYIASLPERARQWDFFVSPNAFTSEVMARSYVFDTEILQAGYPRNDIFHVEDREEIARRTRELLGIAPDTTVLLYAPTWRDDQRHGQRLFKLDLQLDLEEMQRELAGDHVLLFRKHPKLVDSVPGAGQGFIHDVSKYPDIAHLYLIADVLITDYSSAAFDFAHSGKPMLFYTYDLEHYRDTLRGFYFDFTARAPGPLLRTTPELVEAIRDLHAVTEKHRDRYEQFVADFCDPSDGLATRRVIDRMLEIDGQKHGTD